MTKKQLADNLSTVSYDIWRNKTKYDITLYNGGVWEEYKEKYGEEKALEQYLTLASGVACSKLVKGRVSFRATYIVSKGLELPHGKPDAVIETSSHWPYDFAYLYKL